MLVEKECCGNILLQGNLTGLQIWETDIEAKVKLAQITIYSSPSSTDPLEVEIVGTETKLMIVPPGNTVNFIGEGIKSVKVSAKGNELLYIEGKYVISTTIGLHSNPIPLNEQ
ncbi:S-Ena type endospore appendage [Paenibacillus sp. MCAF9]|uniref:S-Ena type endospore appendage n=1 Tax=unclassified Paenibacillus TaxID=185978 RepID=UPI003F9CEA61